MRWFLPYLIVDALKWLFADKEKRALMLLPYNCQYCDLLGMCRDKENYWKCRYGCNYIEPRTQRKRHTPTKV
jgi:hypothetical protein